MDFRSLFVVILSLVLSVSASGSCVQDSCLERLGNSSLAHNYCHQFTAVYSTRLPQPTPAYLSNCGHRAARVSSACSCLPEPTGGVYLKPHAALELRNSLEERGLVARQEDDQTWCPREDGVVHSVNNRRLKVECGVDHRDGDYQDLFGITFSACLTACGNDLRCVALRFVEDTRHCTLKDTIRPPRLTKGKRHPGIIGAKVISDSSGTPTTTAVSTPTPSDPWKFSDFECPTAHETIYDTPSTSYQIQCGMDFSGAGSDSISTTSLTECLQTCDERWVDCTAASWRPPTSEGDQGTCYLMPANFNGPFTQSYVVISAIKIRPFGLAATSPGLYEREEVKRDNTANNFISAKAPSNWNWLACGLEREDSTLYCFGRKFQLYDGSDPAWVQSNFARGPRTLQCLVTSNRGGTVNGMVLECRANGDYVRVLTTEEYSTTMGYRMAMSTGEIPAGYREAYFIATAF